MAMTSNSPSPSSTSNGNAGGVRGIHVALMTANSIFGLGSILGSLGLHHTNPLAFTFWRQIISGILLLLISAISTVYWKSKQPNEYHHPPVVMMVTDTASSLPTIIQSNTKLLIERHWIYECIPRSHEHWKAFFFLGFILFIDQGAYITGIQMAGPVSASIWQPSAPIFTAAIAMLWGWEQPNWKRLLGIFIAFTGCIAMVLLSDDSNDNNGGDDFTISVDSIDLTRIGGFWTFLIGNVMFCIDCCMASVFILLSKRMLEEYSSLMVIGWCYIMASPFMLLASDMVSHASPSIQYLICPTCNNSHNAHVVGHSYYIPYDAVPALVYYVVAMSVGAWGLILWANQYATGTLVMGYSVAQPISTIVFTTLFLSVGVVAKCGNIVDISSTVDSSMLQKDNNGSCLNEPGLGTLLGMAGVFCGLALLITTEPSKDTSIKVDDDTICTASRSEEEVDTRKDEETSLFDIERRRVSSPEYYGAIPLVEVVR